MQHHGPTSWLLQLPLLPNDPHLIHVNSGIVVFLIILVFSVLANLAIRNRMEDHIIPSSRFSPGTLADVLVEKLYGMIMSVLGPHGEAHFSFIAACFIFILVGNFLGLLPLSDSPTSNMNTTIGLGLVSFIYYNVMGIKTHGIGGYLNHFLMGLGIMGLPIAILEIISHVIRPLTLGFRLAINLQVDHILGSTFQNLVAWILPIPMLIFGILVCLVQAYVFTILTSVYVQMATEHTEHEEHH